HAGTRPALLAPRSANLARLLARPALPAGEHYNCPAPTWPGQMSCLSVTRSVPAPGSRQAAAAPTANGPYAPADLLSAYKLATYAARNGTGRTIAIVDAFSDPNAAADLGHYRAKFHLPSCTTGSGCLRIVNESGSTSPLPKPDAGWAGEESLDLDMVSAICPRCRVLLVEARSASPADLGVAEDTAVKMGARFVSNSWSTPTEGPGQDSLDHYFNHPGVAIAFASGDSGLGLSYPTDLQYVTAVGGTTLTRAGNGRGWAETAWGPGSQTDPGATGSGCSMLAAKPSWQLADASQPGGCLNRTENDVAAVANQATGVYVYDSYLTGGSDWQQVGGTSAATPIVTATYALAGIPARNSYPAEYPYLHASHLFDVTTGSNGTCEAARQYLCNAVRGYDGPTGLGTPDGTGAFSSAGAHLITLVDPGTQDVRRGAALSLRITGLDTRSVTSLRYQAAGLPSGLSVHSVAHSTNGLISGTLPGAPGTFRVTLTATDGSVTGSTRFTIVIASSLTGASTAAEVHAGSGSWCLDDSGGSKGALVTIRTCTGVSSQLWKYLAAGGPGDAGTLRIAGLCLGLSGSDGALAGCNGSPGQQWVYLGFGELANLGASRCLTAATLTAGARVQVAACTGRSRQTWTLPAGSIVSAAGSRCLDNPGNSSSAGTSVDVAACGRPQDNWILRGDGTIRSATGLCLSVNGSGLSGTAVVIETCDNLDLSQLWLTGPGGELINYGSARCLTDPASGGPGTVLRQDDCYGQAGQVWGLS
ncbi:MAG TPA: ricin-type beta-trefoil lectin domain protein, partial [Streptosporangiaceae bacterium]